MEIALRETQTRFYALDLKNIFTAAKPAEQSGDAAHLSVDDGFNLLKLNVREADKDGALQFLASTFDPYDQVIRDGIYEGGRKLITLCGVPQLLSMSMQYGQQEMRRAVEIELAVKLRPDRSGDFYLLQIRPMVDIKMQLDEDIREIPDEDALIRSHNAIGHGIITDVQDIVYVKTEQYTASHNPTIAEEIESINRQFLNEGRNYVLVGPGRWGSSDPWLGIPVKWSAISAAKVIVEAGLQNFRVEPSQGTHFFQNLTSFGVGYFTVNDYQGSAGLSTHSQSDGIFRMDVLNQMPAVNETAHVRHVRLSQPLVIKIEGMKKEGIVMQGDKS